MGSTSSFFKIIPAQEISCWIPTNFFLILCLPLNLGELRKYDSVIWNSFFIQALFRLILETRWKLTKQVKIILDRIDSSNELFPADKVLTEQ